MNVRSILSKGKFENLKTQILNSKAQVVTISETWLKKEWDSSLISIPGYNLLRVDRNWGDIKNDIKKGGGLCIYIKNNLNYNDIVYSSNNTSSSNIEMQWVEINIKNMRRILIVNTYRPPSGDYKNFCNIIRDSIVNSNIKNNTDIFIMGDMNIDILDTKSIAKKELDLTMKKLCLKNINKEYTRQSQYKNSCIDLIFSNSDYILNNGLLDWNISDHMGIFITRKKSKINNKKIEFEGRSYKNYIKEDFQWNIINEKWDQFYESTDPNEAWMILKNINIDEMCPIKTLKINEKRDPWISNELMERVLDKNKLLKKSKKKS